MKEGTVTIPANSSRHINIDTWVSVSFSPYSYVTIVNLVTRFGILSGTDNLHDEVNGVFIHKYGGINEFEGNRVHVYLSGPFYNFDSYAQTINAGWIFASVVYN